MSHHAGTGTEQRRGVERRAARLAALSRDWARGLRRRDVAALISELHPALLETVPGEQVEAQLAPVREALA